MSENVTGIVVEHAAWASLLADAVADLPNQVPNLADLIARRKDERLLCSAVAASLRMQASAYAIETDWPCHAPGTRRELRDVAAINTDGYPEMELEAKALYTFDVVLEGDRRDRMGDKPSHILVRWFDAAVRRLQPAADKGEACFVLSFVTHLMGSVPTGLLPLSYEGHQIRAIEFCEGSAESLYQNSERWKYDLERRYDTPVARISRKLGVVESVPVWLDSYVAGPLPRSSPTP